VVKFAINVNEKKGWINKLGVVLFAVSWLNILPDLGFFPPKIKTPHVVRVIIKTVNGVKITLKCGPILLGV
jgi:hypothetical protein